MDIKLLVVDDDPNICEALRLFFENEGCKVKTAMDGAEAINAFKMFEPDLVLLDVMMPKKDGSLVVRTWCFHHGPSLVGELRSHKPLGAAKKAKTVHQTQAFSCPVPSSSCLYKFNCTLLGTFSYFALKSSSLN